MIKQEKKPKTQDLFLDELKKSRKLVEINLVNGIVLNGRLLKIDNFSILVEIDKKKSLIYKHSIAFIK